MTKFNLFGIEYGFFNPCHYRDNNLMINVVFVTRFRHMRYSLISHHIYQTNCKDVYDCMVGI